LTILVSYSEIALKSRYVRSQLEQKLSQDIINHLKKGGYTDPTARRRYGRIYIDGVPNEAVDVIARVFGVANVMPSTEVDADFESVVNGIVEEAKKNIKKGESFAVRPKVVGDHKYGSRDVAYEAGSRVLEALNDREISVNLDSPDITFYAEVRDKEAFVFSKIMQGVLGLPHGSQGKAVSLFSGGIDSPVATWLLMKRGVAVLPLFMDQGPFVGPSYVNRAVEGFKQIASYVPRSRYSLYSAPMGAVMRRITESPEPRYTCILCKRSMYRIAQYFAETHEAKAIITGESLGQVASQTLSNLFVLSAASDIPILRPLIGLDKVEIENMARNIGTYNITAVSIDGCKAVPKGPATRSRIETIEDLEKKLDLKNLCLEAAESISIIAEE
jgi:tRNA uracil 4-sulfurtransferase